MQSQNKVTPADASSMRAARFKLNWLTKLALALTALVLTLLALELGVRLFLSSEYNTQQLEDDLERSAIGSFTQSTDDQTIVYQLRPNLNMTWKDRPLVTNDTGSCRIDSKSLPASSNNPHASNVDSANQNTAASARIAVIGDSTPFGWGVRFKQAYPMLVHQELITKVGRPIALRNFCVPGYNTVQQVGAFKKWAMNWSPSLLIVHYDHNDAEGVGLLPPGAMPPDYGDNFLRSALVKFTARRLRAWQVSGQYFELNGQGLDGNTSKASDHEDEHQREHSHDSHTNHGHNRGRDGGETINNGFNDANPDVMRYHAGYVYSGAHYQDHLEAYRKLAKLTRDMNLPVVVVLFDSAIKYEEDLKDDEHYQKLHVGLNETLKAQGFHVIDLYHAYRDYYRAQGAKALDAMRLSTHDQHPNEQGHRFIAARVSKFISSNTKLMQHLANHQPGHKTKTAAHKRHAATPNLATADQDDDDH